jgi:SAM-dependent methyltransferase
VVACDYCGFCFADKIPEQTSFDTYYRDMSKYEKTERGDQDSPYDQARFKAIADIILRFLDSREVRIFEVGCANGQLLSLLKKEGYENVAGIDPSPVSADIARRRYGINISANTLSDLSMHNGTADFVILAGVLEHVRQIGPALQKLRSMLSAEGSLFITVPDASRYAQGEDAPFQEFSVEHINFFGPDSLTNVLNVNGFVKISIIEDMIESNYRTVTPVIHGIFRKSELPTSIAYSRDTKTEAGLQMYIDQSIQRDRLLQAEINKVVEIGRPIIVWGAGAHTLRLLANSRLVEAKIRAFVDSNPRYQGKALNSIPIISPELLKNLHEPILISSRVYQEEIVTQIHNELKLTNEVIRLYKVQ